MLGKVHLLMLTAMNNLASLWREQRPWKEMEELRMKLVEAGLEDLFDVHPSSPTAMGQPRWHIVESGVVERGRDASK